MMSLMNHDGLFINRMRRFIPATLLNVLEKWLGICYTYVSWNSACSHMFKLTSGQGGVLSPYLFAAYIDELINHVHNRQIGCMYNCVNACIVMYADVILLLAPSVHSLQILVSACESMLGQLDFAINVRKVFVSGLVLGAILVVRQFYCQTVLNCNG